MSKVSDFFKPKRMGFHLLLAVGIVVFICILASVLLKFYTRHNEEIEMPKFIGQSSAQLIENPPHDFIIVVTDQVFDQKQPDGTVIKQNPLPNLHVKKGRKVYLTISSSTPPMVKMPALKDISLRQSELMLKALGLKVGDIIYKPSPFDNAVIDQLYKGRSIAGGTEIGMGEKITLVVGRNVGGDSEGVE
ncbi:MAG: PASTA domain-containing protein [Bacteroidales bacterium]|jgi:beta-lactam-binding protein with PASTA domain|nr:PASTA domain-containing protein [Bacteroidales bacterium]